MEKNREIAINVLEAIGGKENVEFAAHCATRLRLNLKDESKLDEQKVKDVKGVVGLNKVGKQYQIVIGMNVSDVYDYFCEEADIKPEAAVEENLDKAKKKITVKSILGSALDYLSASMFTATPVLMVAGLFNCICVICGPNMLNILSADSDFYILCSAIYNAGFYFLPIFVGYTAARKAGMTPLLGMLIGAILIAPELSSIISEGGSFTVYGIHTTLYDYSSTIMPVILSVWFTSYIEKFFNKHLPTVLKASFSPFLTILVAIPFVLIILAPLGTILSNAICDAVFAFYDKFGVVALVIMCTFSVLLTITGMHVALGTISAVAIITTQYDPFFFVAGILSNFTIMGMCLASAVKLHKQENKSEAIGYFVSSALGGVTEPGLYGLAMKYKTPFLGIFAGGAAGGLYAGLTKTAVHMFPPTSNFLAVVAYFGDTNASVVNAIITVVIGFTVSAAVTYFFGYRNVTED